MAVIHKEGKSWNSRPGLNCFAWGDRLPRCCSWHIETSPVWKVRAWFAPTGGHLVGRANPLPNSAGRSDGKQQVKRIIPVPHVKLSVKSRVPRHSQLIHHVRSPNVRYSRRGRLEPNLKFSTSEIILSKLKACSHLSKAGLISLHDCPLHAKP